MMETSHNNQPLQVHVIFGPTAYGKGKIAISLWEKYGYPIISVDSRKVYKGADIGTNKLVTLNFMKNHPDALVGGLDLLEPSQGTSVFFYQQSMYQWLSIYEATIRQAGGLILHGGTGLYFDALIKGLSLFSKADDKVRSELNQLSVIALQERAMKVNAERFSLLNNSDRMNPRRLIRVIENAGAQENPQQSIPHAIFQGATLLQYPLTSDKEALTEAQNTRVYRYLEEGWLDEVASLRDKFGDNAPALQMMGYKQLVRFMVENENWRELAKQRAGVFLDVIAEIQQEHRRYAKRQLTWGRKVTFTD